MAKETYTEFAQRIAPGNEAILKRAMQLDADPPPIFDTFSEFERAVIAHIGKRIGISYEELTKRVP